MSLSNQRTNRFISRIASIVIVILVFTQMNFVYANTYKLNDIEESYAKEEIQKLVEDKIIDGYEDKSFRPDNNITRAELAKIISKLLDLEINQSSTSHFEDAGDAWFTGYVNATYEKGIMIGKSEKYFAPNDNVTREEIATIFIRILGLDHKEEIEESEEIYILEITDLNEISQWALESVTSAIKLGLMEAKTNLDGTRTFNPKELADRQLVAKVSYEVKYNNSKYTDLAVNEQLEEQEKNEENKEEQKNPSQPEKPSYESIVSKYRSKFSSLQSKYESSLNSLISKALAEKEAGASISELALKYMDLAASLESEADSEFYSVLSSFQSELEEYEYDTSVVDEAENEYNSLKAEKENEILGQL